MVSAYVSASHEDYWTARDKYQFFVPKVDMVSEQVLEVPVEGAGAHLEVERFVPANVIEAVHVG